VRIAGIVLLLVIGGFSVRAMVGGDRKGAGANRGSAGTGSHATAPPAPAAPPAPIAPPTVTPPPAAPAADAAVAVAAKPAATGVDAAAVKPEAGTGGAQAAEEPPSEPSEPGESPAKEKRAQVPVHIKSDPEGTKVSTGKHVFGSTPITIRMRPGNSYELTFAKAGYTTLSRRYRFDADTPQTLRVSLKKLPEPPKKPTPPPPPPPAGPPPAKKSSWFGR
jgi:hypothetical protein